MRLDIGSRPVTNLDLEIAELGEGADLELGGDDRELCAVLLGGRCSAEAPEAGLERRMLGGRRDVFDGPAAALYVPPRQRCRVVAQPGGVRLAIVSAAVPAGGPEPGSEDLEVYAVTPDELHVESRGRGVWQRTVYDILGAAQPARRLVVGETFSRAGVWSGYPPHKHDRENPPLEHRFDEVFYIRVQPRTGFGVLLHYPAGAAREAATVVRDGDVVAVGEGYHSFVAAAEHEFYYLWALAGEHRELAMSTDPRHRWILDLPVPVEEAP